MQHIILFKLVIDPLFISKILVLILSFLLCQARALISKLTEERNSLIEQNKRLQQELVLHLFHKFSFEDAYAYF